MSTDLTNALTLGEISRRLGEPLHRVRYVAESRNLLPIARVGRLRVYAEADLQFIRAELARIDAEREGCRAF